MTNVCPVLGHYFLVLDTKHTRRDTDDAELSAHLNKVVMPENVNK